MVGSKNSTEQIVVGEIVAQQLERRLGATVNRELNLGPTLMLHQALLLGQVDIYPEYPGRALTNLVDAPPEADPAVVYERVRQEFERQQVLLFPRLGYASGDAVVVSGNSKLETISDAAAVPEGWMIGADHDFIQRPDGYALLMRIYNLPVRVAPQPLSGKSIYDAMNAKQITLAVIRDTDGRLAASGLKRLRDDRGAFPPSEAALVARTDTLARYPGMRQALNELSGKLTHRIIEQMDAQVEVGGRTPASVAAEFLKKP